MSEEEIFKLYLANYCIPQQLGSLWEGGLLVYTTPGELDSRLHITGSYICNSCSAPIWICDCIEKGQFHPMKINVLIEKLPCSNPEEYRKYLNLHEDTCKCRYKSCPGKAHIVYSNRYTGHLTAIGKPFCKLSYPKDNDELLEAYIKRYQSLKKAGFHPLYNYCQLQDQVKTLTQEVESLKKALADTLTALAIK